MGPIYTWQDFLDMIRRRLGLIAFVVIAGCIASLYWASSYVHVYRSSEVIQVEQPKIDDELAPSTVGASSARRLQLIEQKLMARANLQNMIDKYGLFSNLEALRPSEKVNLLRQSVSITGVAAAREGFADDGTISVLTITVDLEDPVIARDVAHDFAERTRALMREQRQEQTAATLAFFERQEEQILTALAALENEIETFRKDNDITVEGGLQFRLTEIGQLNESILELDRGIIAAQLARTQIDRSARQSTIERAERDIDTQLATLTEQRSLLTERRDALRASVQSSPETQRQLDAFERRREQLQAQLESISARRSDAEVGATLEAASQGERLTTLEEAQVPDYPITMSRKKRAILGGGASVALAIMLAWLLELRRPVIRSARQMERETGVTPVVSIPELEAKFGSSKWRQRREKRRAAGKAGRAARIARQTS